MLLANRLIPVQCWLEFQRLFIISLDVDVIALRREIDLWWNAESEHRHK